MKKILILITCIFLTSCTWNYKNGNIQKNIDAKTLQEQELELEKLEQEKAKETLEKIAIEKEIASEILENFLKNDDFDIKAEIERTKQKYNDNLGPILEYEHEKKPEEETSTGETLTGTTLSGSTIINLEGDNTEVTGENNVYSGETKLVNSNQITAEKDEIIQETDNTELTTQTKKPKFNTQEKKGRSGTYTMYIGLSDQCLGGLEMTDLENNKKWLFENTCNQMIYNFELAIGGIKVYYNDKQGNNLDKFVSIK